MPLRERFPIFQSRTYFDSCSHGALSDEVRQAYLSYLEDRDRFGSHWEVWAGKLETLRTMLAQLLNVSADEIATASCLSDCLNSLVSAFDFSGERNKVLLTDSDFPTTAQIWRAQERRGAVIDCVPCHPGEVTIPPERFLDYIDETTLVVSLPDVCYRNGARLDEKYASVNQRYQVGQNPYLSIDANNRVKIRTPRTDYDKKEFIASTLS